MGQDYELGLDLKAGSWMSRDHNQILVWMFDLGLRVGIESSVGVRVGVESQFQIWVAYQVTGSGSGLDSKFDFHVRVGSLFINRVLIRMSSFGSVVRIRFRINHWDRMSDLGLKVVSRIENRGWIPIQNHVECRGRVPI